MLIKFEQVTKSFGSVDALQEVNFIAEPGEVIALCGPNGAGKSTFLQLAVGLIQPTIGTVKVMGQDPSRNWQLKRRIGYAGDPSDLIGEMTVEELLCYTGKLRGIASGIDVETERLMELFQMTSKRAEWICHLSEGMRRKTTLLQALVAAPPLLLLDEPTSGLDIEIQASCRQLLAERSRRGTALVVGTHDFRLIDAIKPRIILLDSGRITAAGSLVELLSAHDCENAEELVLKLWPRITVSV